jgi:hypothetical protein
MSALPPKADINRGRLECLLSANSGHSIYRQNDLRTAGIPLCTDQVMEKTSVKDYSLTELRQVKKICA